MFNYFATVAVFVLSAVSAVTAHDATAANGNTVQKPHNFARSNIEHGHGNHHIAKRCGGWGVGGGCGGWGGFPFAANTVNAFDRNAYAANCCDNTVFTNNKNANVVCDNVNVLNAANVIA
ncbi:hypothetical protein BX661DRAFT_201068 [Kickxella alabastrina]|uniref:uncharacterized protein n=1 Tax=Kickxella alabastrina TaxID=61397 RepID=UPI00221F3E93|nr:uncharacterized protein BX661DRAFT_173704 [Kickxella alabastrina]XP_051388650.1 uncharacterized protein BX661DRAFT_201068 [Kickxella alabastrina]KAI7820201.1 hypothetical protein BX661DRAFT_173704 [Kickxella alabastrina]KAI7820204.1 hypothetical protein BX661DRAFT_201068 [Kickxella alabastrina]